MTAGLQDKVGPFARSAADAAVVLDTIRGRDPQDPSSFDSHLEDPFTLAIQNLTVGYLPQTPPPVSFGPFRSLAEATLVTQAAFCP